MNPDYSSIPDVYEYDVRRPDAKRGEQYILIRPHAIFSIGTVVTLEENDGSICPYFTAEGFRDRCPVLWNKLAPVSNTTSTSESDGQIAKVKKLSIIKGIYS